jgi:excisionase family DNA binding protein
MPNDLLTVPDVAAELGVTPTWIWKLTRTGELPAVMVRGRRMVRRQDLDAYTKPVPYSPVESRQTA